MRKPCNIHIAMGLCTDVLHQILGVLDLVHSQRSSRHCHVAKVSIQTGFYVPKQTHNDKRRSSGATMLFLSLWMRRFVVLNLIPT